MGLEPRPACNRMSSGHQTDSPLRVLSPRLPCRTWAGGEDWVYNPQSDFHLPHISMWHVAHITPLSQCRYDSAWQESQVYTALWNVWHCLLGLMQDFLDHKHLIRYFNNHHFALGRACALRFRHRCIQDWLDQPRSIRARCWPLAWIKCHVRCTGSLVFKKSKASMKLMSIMRAVFILDPKHVNRTIETLYIIFMHKSSETWGYGHTWNNPVWTSPCQGLRSRAQPWMAQQWSGEGAERTQNGKPWNPRSTWSRGRRECRSSRSQESIWTQLF